MRLSSLIHDRSVSVAWTRRPVEPPRTVICRFETYIRNKLDWKQSFDRIVLCPCMSVNVSNLKRLFPMSFFCFQSKTIVSNLKRLFPIFFMFSIYFVSNLCFQSTYYPFNRLTSTGS